MDDDRALLEGVAAGDRAAFTALWRLHQPAVRRFAAVLAGDAADDVVQETFLQAHRGAAAFRGEGSVRGWLLGIARFSVMRLHRRHAGEPRDHEPLEALGQRAGWGSDDPERLASLAEDRDRVRAALARLAVEDREVLLLRDVEGLAGEDVAHALGLAIPAMKSRLHRARLRLAAAVREGGPDGR